jgi:hypothetical protein
MMMMIMLVMPFIGQRDSTAQAQRKRPSEKRAPRAAAPSPPPPEVRLQP